MSPEVHTGFRGVYPVEGVRRRWLEVSNEEQARRFEARLDDPLRQWKLSPVDLPSRSRWYDYSRARDMMFEATDTEFAPWYIFHQRAAIDVSASTCELQRL